MRQTFVSRSGLARISLILNVLRPLPCGAVGVMTALTWLDPGGMSSGAAILGDKSLPNRNL